jgi:hypothetical protein
MRFNRLIAPAVLALTLAACSKEDDPTGPSEVDQRIAAAEALATLSTKISDPAAQSAAEQAAAALNLGAKITTVSLTTTATSIARASGLNTRVSADIGNATEEWQATALQVVIQNSQTTAANGTFNVVAMWKGESDLVFVGAPAAVTSGSIGTTGAGAFGGLFTNPNQSWQATGGTAAITGTGTESACAGFPSVTGLTCVTANFTAGFNITSSAPYSGGGNAATGSRTAALTARSLQGLKVTVNCASFSC